MERQVKMWADTETKNVILVSPDGTCVHSTLIRIVAYKVTLDVTIAPGQNGVPESIEDAEVERLVLEFYSTEILPGESLDELLFRLANKDNNFISPETEELLNAVCNEGNIIMLGSRDFFI